MNSPNAEWPKKFQAAQEQVQQLKAEQAAAAQEIARLKRELDVARDAASTLSGTVSPGGKRVRASAGGRGDEVTSTDIVNAEKEVADLQFRLSELQGKVGLARNKVTSLQYATVDTRLSPPDGHSSHPYDWGTRSGNFSSELHKQNAIRDARAELVPIEIELRMVQDGLAKAKLNLGKMRATQGTN